MPLKPAFSQTFTPRTSSGPIMYSAPTGAPPGFVPGASAMVAGLGTSTGITGERLTGFCSCAGLGGACSSGFGGAVFCCTGGTWSCACLLQAGRIANSAANNAVLIAYLGNPVKQGNRFPSWMEPPAVAFPRILFTSVQHLLSNSNGSRTTKTSTGFTWAIPQEPKYKEDADLCHMP